MNFKLFAAVFSAVAIALPASAQQIKADVSSAWQMVCYINGYLVQASASRYVTRSFADGKTGNKMKILANKQFKNYDGKCGAVIVKGDRFWWLGGEGTVNNKKWQSVDTVLTGTVDAAGKISGLKAVRKLPFATKNCRAYLHDNKISGLKAVRKLPFATKNCRAYLHDNKIYLLGGFNRSDFIVADIKADGELGEWKKLPSYPNPVYCGGLVLYKGCFYANGQSTWRRGSSKMYALKLNKNGTTARKWERVESPDNAQGHLVVQNNALYYIDEISGKIYKTTQDAEDGIQLNEWKEAGKAPFAAGTSNTTIAEVPGGRVIMGGFKPFKNKKFAGFFSGVFLPASALK